MYPIWIAIVFISLVAFYSASEIPRRESEMAYVSADVGAINFLSYRRAVSKFMDSNPAASGLIDDAALGPFWQPGYVRDPKWTNEIEDGALYVYSTAPISQDIVVQVHKRTNESLLVGIKDSVTGRLLSPKGFDTGVVLPASIPDNSFVMIGR